MNIFWTKILVAILFGVLRLIFGLLPIKLYEYLKIWERDETGEHHVNKEKREHAECFLTLVHSFGGGVLLATCFLHMIPEVHHAIHILEEYHHTSITYPVSQLIICFGFFMVYFVEELAHFFISKLPGQTEENKVTPVSNGHVKLDHYVDFQIDKPEAEKELEEVEAEERTEKEIVTALEKSPKRLLRCILITSALSFHAVFEGIAIGLQNSVSNIWYLFVAVSIHSITLLFCVGVELLFSHKTYFVIFLFVFVLSITSPIGVFIGLGVTTGNNDDTTATSTASAILEGLSAGTILYITFFEVLAKEKEKHDYRISRGVSLLAGFGIMALLQTLE